MPAKFVLKQYVENGIYHIYNRGVNKSKIFLDKSDYKIFLNYLKLYLLPKEEIIKNIDNLNLPFEIKMKKEISIRTMESFYQRIRFFAFVLMPNHFHLLIQQKDRLAIKFFLKSLLVKYVMYFNRKYNRIGPLFQGRYRGVLVDKDEYFLHLSRYIHLNPKEILFNKQELVSYPWSSYPLYIRNYQVKWLDKSLIQSYFSKVKGFGFSSYQRFVEGYNNDQEDFKLIEDYLIDY